MQSCSSESRLRIVVHVGPHRTGSTSTQAILSQVRASLANSGIWYPECRFVKEAHHLLAWRLLNRDLAVFSASTENRTPSEILQQWVSEARNASCHTLLLSSEDFAVLRDTEWQILMDSVFDVSWHLVAVYRAPKEVARSAYSELLLNGLSQKFATVEHVLAQGCADFYVYLQQTKNGNQWASIETVQYRANHKKFLSEIIGALCGSKLAQDIISEVGEVSLGMSIDESMWPLLLDFNRLNTPDFALDVSTGAFPTRYYESLHDELPKIRWVANLANELARFRKRDEAPVWKNLLLKREFH